MLEGIMVEKMLKAEFEAELKIGEKKLACAVLEDGTLKYPEIGLKNETYYFELIDKLAGKGSFFSRLFT